LRRTRHDQPIHRTSYQPIDDTYLRVLNIAMKSSSCTGTRLNWRRNSKKRDDSVEGLMLYFSVVVVVVFVAN